MKEIKNTAIVGMGALGLMYGEHIATAMGKDAVTFILDDERYKSYQKKVFTCNGETCNFNFHKSSDKNFFDLVIVAVKYNALESALDTMKNCIGPDTIIISVMNGISSEQIIGRRFGMEKLLITIAQEMDAMREGTDLVFTKKGVLVIGKPQCPENSLLENIESKNNVLDITQFEKITTENLTAVKNYFDKIKLPYRIEENIMYRLWAKWMLNVGINQTCAVFDTNYKTATTPGKIMDTFVDAMKEVVELSKLEGINLAESEVDNYIRIIKTLAPEGYPSMAQDRKAHRPSEVEMFAGTVIQLAAKHNLPVPVNQFLYDEMKKIEAGY